MSSGSKLGTKPNAADASSAVSASTVTELSPLIVSRKAHEGQGSLVLVGLRFVMPAGHCANGADEAVPGKASDRSAQSVTNSDEPMIGLFNRFSF